MVDMNFARNYLFELSEDEKIIFLRVFSKMAHIDGHMDENEKEYIRYVAMSLDIAPQKVHKIFADNEDKEIIRDVAAIKNRRVALELIKEMCVLAHTDDKFTDEEILFIGKVGEALGVELEKIEQISNWVVDRLIWLNQGKIIFEEV